MNFLLEFGQFALQAAVILACIVVVILLLASLVQRGRGVPELEMEQLDERWRELTTELETALLPRGAQKKHRRAQRKQAKAQLATPGEKPNVFLVEFKGDLRASQVAALRTTVTLLIRAAKKNDQVVVAIESPGGLVPSYGLAASQLERLKRAGLRVTACVDKIAASGGYMMACVADRIVAAPFAVIGSIGVIAQVPNLHRLLKKHEIDYEEVTAGEFKRTVSLLGPVTEQGREKLREQIADTHGLFKKLVQEHRSQLEIEKVATGEIWYGQQALELGLVDEVATSDELLCRLAEEQRIFKVSYHPRRPLRERFAVGLSETVQQLWDRLWQRSQRDWV